MLTDKFSFTTQRFDVLFRTNAEILGFVNKEAELVREIEIGFVVGCRGEEDDLALVLLDVILNGAVAFTLTVSEVMALVNHNETVAPKVW